MFKKKTFELYLSQAINFIVLQINEDDVREWETEKVIDLLRKTHGKIALTVLQQPF